MATASRRRCSGAAPPYATVRLYPGGDAPARTSGGLASSLVVQGRMGGGQTGYRHPEGRAAHVVEAHLVAEGDGRRIAAVLEEMSLLLELTGANPFKCRAYANGARALDALETTAVSLILNERPGSV